MVFQQIGEFFRSPSFRSDYPTLAWRSPFYTHMAQNIFFGEKLKRKYSEWGIFVYFHLKPCSAPSNTVRMYCTYYTYCYTVWNFRKFAFKIFPNFRQIYTMCFFHEIFSNESKLLVFFPRTFHSSNIIGTHCIKVFKDRSKWEKFEFKRLFSWIIALLVINFEIVPQV